MERREDTSITIAATVTGLAATIAFVAVFYEFWLRHQTGWAVGFWLGKWTARLAVAVSLVGLGALGLGMGARAVRTEPRRGRVLVVVAAVLSLMLGVVCLLDETVRAETAIIFEPSQAWSRPWELSLAHRPNAWLRYQLLRGCGAGAIVAAIGLLGSLGATRDAQRA